ncbi:MAG: carboxypeptidase M32 [Verrucomicrobia bacterium]|nr:carboxypeptidase M32 [Verrucomicrobiota bacterium]MDA1068149.1 carboxypeptidase M32 [Verrucomicrobiota bacterium]
MLEHSSLKALLEKQAKQHHVGTVLGLLGWDEQVNLPPASSDQRAQEMAVLSEIRHQLGSDSGIGTLLQNLENDWGKLNDQEQCVVKNSRKDFDRATRLPADYVTEKAVLDSQAYHAWVAARERNDFAAFAPFLKRQVEMSIRGAELMGESDNPYDYQIDLFDPGMTAEIIEGLFKSLKEELVPLARSILDSPIKAKTEQLRGFPVDKQKAFLTDVTETLGFNYKRGRIDVAVHPFCSGNACDTRLTTRFDEDVPLDSLFSSIHETGHGLYEQGLPIDQLHNALGQAVGMGIHESQSRLWENQVSRSREFWQFFEPRYRAAFPEQLAGLSSDDLYLAVNSVTLCPIRVDSDEVTYNLHIILRFELEKKLIGGELSVDDLPAEWNRLSKEIIGLTPPSDKEGVLQDVHWSGGMFGYFPSYCLGNMIAAQLWYKVLEEIPDLLPDFSQGKFDRLLTWLRNGIHQHGKLYDTQDLVTRVTGEPINPKYLIRYLKDRYLPLYES